MRATRPMDEFDFRCKEDKERLSLGARQIMGRVLHEAYLKIEEEHLGAKKERRYITLVPDRKAIGERLLSALTEVVAGLETTDAEALSSGDVQN